MATKTKIKVNNLTKGARMGVPIVFGPNLHNPATAATHPWEARRQTQTGASRRASQALYISNVGLVQPDAKEIVNGCTQRASGVTCSMDDIVAALETFGAAGKLEPMKFKMTGNEGAGYFTDLNGNYVEPTHLACLPNKQILGVRKQ